MKNMTLIFLHRGDEILLAQKKRGFGMGRWNGAGGKLEPEETIEQALVRECQEEIGVKPSIYHQVAELKFNAYMKGEWVDLIVHVFMCDEWDGEPIETEEMRPQWFKKDNIPYDDMWQDDRYWLPLVLEGKYVKGIFTFDKDDNLLEHSVEGK